jgi:microcystin-dependent protein
MSTRQAGSGMSEEVKSALEAYLNSNEFESLLRTRMLLPGARPGDLKASASPKDQPGWLLCNGDTFLITAYPELYAALGITWGGDGITTFAIPDLRGRALISEGEFTGVITLRTVGQYGGAETHQMTTTEMPAHSHVLVEPNGGLGHRHAINVNFNPGAKNSLTHGGTTFDASDPSYEQYSTTGLTMQNTGSNGFHNNMQPFAVVSWLIKT